VSESQIGRPSGRRVTNLLDHNPTESIRDEQQRADAGLQRVRSCHWGKRAAAYTVVQVGGEGLSQVIARLKERVPDRLALLPIYASVLENIGGDVVFAL
jgi:hypothetical protein